MSKFVSITNTNITNGTKSKELRRRDQKRDVQPHRYLRLFPVQERGGRRQPAIRPNLFGLGVKSDLLLLTGLFRESDNNTCTRPYGPFPKRQARSAGTKRSSVICRRTAIYGNDWPKYYPTYATPKPTVSYDYWQTSNQPPPQTERSLLLS